MAVNVFSSEAPATLLAEKMLGALGKALPAVIYHRVRVNSAWEYTFAGAPVADFFGSSEDVVFGGRGFDYSFIHHEDRLRVGRSYDDATSGYTGIWQSDFRIVSRAGVTRWIRAFAEIETVDRHEKQAVVILVDDGTRAIAREGPADTQEFDVLTGLYSRSHFERAVADAAALHERIDCPFAIVAFDVDDFHEVNEAHGSDVGDQLLCAIAKAASDLARASIVSRLEGDTFAVLVDAADASDVISFTSDLIALFKRPFHTEEQTLWISASAGITFATNVGRTATELLREADSALRQARSAGGGNFRVYSPEINDQVLSRFALKESLHEAVAKEQFELHYQPKINITSGAVVGVEALLRWNHPELGLQSPARFIPIAERTGLIIQIGEWVFREACRQYSEWRRSAVPLVPIAVNVSAVQFARSDVFRTISRALAEFDVPPAAIQIEITEGLLVDCTDELIAELRRIRDLGIGIALDDFGTGFSSLAYLQRLPLSILKVDQTFVRGGLKNERDAAIVRSIVQLARHLDMRTVAEGVETKDQLAFVRNAGCEEAQGYLFSPPLLAADYAWFAGRGTVPIL
jgi:diguanylate cyclase (GGDEF)-like protein